MNTFETVLYRVEDRVATISLNRPDVLNAFNTQLRKELLTAIEVANNDSEVRVVVVSGEGRGFSSGHDLSEDYRERYDRIGDLIREEYKPFLLGIQNSPKLYISSVHGTAAGIGSALALVCDLTIMAENASIFQAFAAIGLIADGGMNWHLGNTLGYKRALEMIVEAGKTPARSCLELGLVNRMVPAVELSDATAKWAAKLAAGAPLAQGHTKQVLQQVMGMTLSDVIDLEAKMQNINMISDDAREGAKAFFEKRSPVFSGT